MQAFNKVASVIKTACLIAILGISTCDALAQTWTLTSSPLTNWAAITCSADGSKVSAAVGGWKTGPEIPPGLIYESTNSGLTWTSTTAPVTNWSVLTCSADGSAIYGSMLHRYYPNPIYSSSDSGDTWHLTGSPMTNFWMSIDCSADGKTLVASFQDYGHVPGGVFVSTNSGLSWNQPLATYNGWPSVACSANGTVMVAPSGSGFPSGFYRSQDSGKTWTLTNSLAYALVVLSADASGLIAATPSGAVLTSTNLGDTWQGTVPTNVSWGALACSADAQTIVVAYGSHDGYYQPTTGPLYFSTNAGQTWSRALLPNANWASVACSADGAKIFAADSSGGIYTLQAIPAPNLSITASNSNVLLSWLVPSTPFVLQQNPDLRTTNWTEVAVAPALNYTNLNLEVRVAAPVAAMFYRLAALQE